MPSPIFIIGFVAVVLIILFLLNMPKKKIGEKADEFPYEKKSYLMSPAEREFFFILKKAIEDMYYIVPQMQLSKIIQPEKGKRWQYGVLNKIDRKSVDFVLFNKEYFTPQIVIELDEFSHSQPSRIIRDKFIDAAMQKAGIKIVHIRTAQNYKTEEILNWLK